MLASSARVFTAEEKRAFDQRYFRRNRIGNVRSRMDRFFEEDLVDVLRVVSDRFGVKRPLKIVYRWIIGDGRAGARP